MKQMIDIVALGELLIDFTEAGVGADGMKLFEQNPGGAPANLLTVASHMGYRTEFIGKVGKDMHGAFLKKTLEKEKIGVLNLIEDEHYFTTLAFVAIDENGEREFSFSRKPGADTKLQADELNLELLQNCKIFHFGSLSLTAQPAHEATVTAVSHAKAAGALISYDPNYRASLWSSEDVAIETMKSMICYADVMKISDEESLLLTGEKTYEAAADQLLQMGPKLVAVTLGSEGVLIAFGERKERIAGFQVKSVDTTGAGDSFWGGFLSAYLEFRKPVEELSWKEIKYCAEYGNATAALCVQKRGGIPAIPKKEEVSRMIRC